MKTTIIVGIMALGIKLSAFSPIEPQSNPQKTTDSLKKEWTDPVCGMKLKPKTSGYQSHTHEKVNYMFCSTSCKNKFVAQPAKYIKKPKT